MAEDDTYRIVRSEEYPKSYTLHGVTVEWTIPDHHGSRLCDQNMFVVVKTEGGTQRIEMILARSDWLSENAELTRLLRAYFEGAVDLPV